MVAKIGRHLKQISNGRMSIPALYALDPAGPGFADEHFEGMEPINKNDADYVQGKSDFQNITILCDSNYINFKFKIKFCIHVEVGSEWNIVVDLLVRN
jgi:hypothetical protein